MLVGDQTLTSTREVRELTDERILVEFRAAHAGPDPVVGVDHDDIGAGERPERLLVPGPAPDRPRPGIEQRAVRRRSSWE